MKKLEKSRAKLILLNKLDRVACSVTRTVDSRTNEETEKVNRLRIFLIKLNKSVQQMWLVQFQMCLFILLSAVGSHPTPEVLHRKWNPKQKLKMSQFLYPLKLTKEKVSIGKIVTRIEPGNHGPPEPWTNRTESVRDFQIFPPGPFRNFENWFGPNLDRSEIFIFLSWSGHVRGFMVDLVQDWTDPEISDFFGPGPVRKFQILRSNPRFWKLVWSKFGPIWNFHGPGVVRCSIFLRTGPLGLGSLGYRPWIPGLNILVSTVCHPNLEWWHNQLSGTSRFKKSTLWFATHWDLYRCPWLTWYNQKWHGIENSWIWWFKSWRWTKRESRRSQ